MTQLLIGYNRNHFFNTANQIDAVGVSLVAKDGEILTLPAGWIVTEVRIRQGSIAALAGSASDVIVYLVEGMTDFDIMTASKADINTEDVNVSLVGTSDAPIANASNVDRFFLVRANSGDCGSSGVNGPSVCVTIKIRPMPTL